LDTPWKVIGMNLFGSLKRLQGNLQQLALAALLALSISSLTACGTGTVEDPLVPGRIIVFGDTISITGTVTGDSTVTPTVPTVGRYTVNDASNNNWVEYLALQYGLTSQALSTTAGGNNYSAYQACVKTMATGCSSTSTLSTQLSAYLAANGNSFRANDLVIFAGGISDVRAQSEQLIAGTQTSTAATAAVKQAGIDLAALVVQAKNAGAQYVAVMGAYDISATPWITASNPSFASNVSALAYNFNFAMLLEMANPIKYANVQYIDAAYQLNLITGNPVGYGYTDSTTIACDLTVVADASTCTTTTLAPAGASSSGTSVAVTVDNYNTFVFADKFHFTPPVHRTLGSYAIGRMRYRWGG
jgi:outer membrane lipase/esterase